MCGDRGVDTVDVSVSCCSLVQSSVMGGGVVQYVDGVAPSTSGSTSYPGSAPLLRIFCPTSRTSALSASQLPLEHHSHDLFHPDMTPFRPHALKGLLQGIAPATRPCLRRPQCWRARPTSPRHPFIRSFSITYAPCKKVDVAENQDPLAESGLKGEEASSDGAAKAERKGMRKNAGKTSSLRRVAVEAQRSRGFVRGTGSKRFVDPEVETKVYIAIHHSNQNIN